MVRRRADIALVLDNDQWQNGREARLVEMYSASDRNGRVNLAYYENKHGDNRHPESTRSQIVMVCMVLAASNPSHIGLKAPVAVNPESQSDCALFVPFPQVTAVVAYPGPHLWL